MIEGFELSEHARHQMQRQLANLCLEETLSNPDRTKILADTYRNTHYLRRIQSFGDRWLRVVVNPNVEPKRVVTVFFDRRIK